MPGGCIVRLCSSLTLPCRAALLALIPDADWVRDESGRKVLDASGAEGQQERTSLRARRAVQLRMHAEEAIDDGELKASMQMFQAREAAIAAERASIGEHSPWRALPLAGTAGRPDAARIWDGLTLGLKRQVIRACCQVPPVEFIAGTTAGTDGPELITVSLRR